MTKNELTEEQLKKIAKFLAESSTDDLKEPDWKNKLIRTDKGKIDNHIDNYILFLSESPKYKGQIKYNEFLQQGELFGKPFDDLSIAVVKNDFERETNLSSTAKFDNALNEVLKLNVYNPVQDYLKSLEWDGTKRIENVFIKLLEADDNQLNKEMSKKWFMAAVKRIMIPGCKFDNILIFQGAQGIGKSTICERISKGFSNIILLSEINNKDVIDKLNKTWIGIIDEMDAFNKKDMTTIKTFLSTSIDATRLAYGRYTQNFKRHCVFIGSTNDETFLRDSTSSTERRFWIIKSHKEKYSPIVNETLTEYYVNQLWAEAYHELYNDIDQYLDIDSSLSDEFSKTMSSFKTFNDDKVIDYVREILDADYRLKDNGEFSDTQDFLNQFTKVNVYTENANQKINKIPMSALLLVLKTVYKEDRGAKYIALALSQEWEYKSIFYKNKTVRGLYRKNQIVNNQEKTNELPF